MTADFIKLRGLENLMLDMYDHPEGVHRLMAFLRDGNLRKIEFLEKEGLLTLNNDGSYVGSGALGGQSSCRSRIMPGACATSICGV